VEKADLEEKQDWTENKAKVSKMRFMKLFVSLAALCLLAGLPGQHKMEMALVLALETAMRTASRTARIRMPAISRIAR